MNIKQHINVLILVAMNYIKYPWSLWTLNSTLMYQLKIVDCASTHFIASKDFFPSLSRAIY